MEIRLNPDLQAKLTRLATDRGSDPESLAREAIERFVDYDEWFARQVAEGLAAADRGDFVEHEDVRRLIDSRFPG
jgi:predicted transcriptional regulator